MFHDQGRYKCRMSDEFEETMDKLRILFMEELNKRRTLFAESKYYQ